MLKWVQKNLMKKAKPKVYVAMPCYGDMKVETCVSLLDTFSALGGSGIECRFKSVKSSLVTHGRNLLTAGFLDSEFDYMLFVDADVEFQPEAVMRMLVPEKDIVCTPYRNKEDPWIDKYSVKFKDNGNIDILEWDLVEIEEGPAGLMLISRKVYEKLMDKHPELKVNFNKATREKMNKEIGAVEDAIDRYMYNFWDTTFRLDTGEWKGEDLAFCERAKAAGFKIYANLDSWTTHHGSYGWKGRFGDYLVNKKAK
jgi:hypothetical protein